MSPWRAAVGALVLAVSSGSEAAPPAPTPLEVGRAIYLRGVLSSGDALEGTRGPDGPRTTGADAACVNCHQRSGFGTEGLTHIPPIAGRYLLRSGTRPGAQRNLPYVEGIRGVREHYDEVTLARAIRAGVDSEGRPLA